MQIFGLIGKTLSHSYSPFLHELLEDTPYRLFPLEEEAFHAFMKERAFTGVNVTIPYKQAAMAYCAKLDETAREIGCVNTVINRGGALHGYNTDAAGLSLLVRRVLPDLKGKTALVLGDGGTSRTARYVLSKLGAARILVASRSPREGTVSYLEAQNTKDIHLLLNTTPVGMYPNNGALPFPLETLPQLEAVVDVVYNPAKTALVLAAEKRGLPAIGGLAMLAEQARAASSLFLEKEQPVQRTKELCTALQNRIYNLVLIGMPGCGKTSLGRMLAKETNRSFVDLDHVLEQEEGRSAKAILETEGEAAFRDIESRIAKSRGKENGQVIATGGGVILREENLDALRQNGIIIWVDCPLSALTPSNSRPLSQNQEALCALYEKRHPLYQKAADLRFERPSGLGESIAALALLANEALPES